MESLNQSQNGSRKKKLENKLAEEILFNKANKINNNNDEVKLKFHGKNNPEKSIYKKKSKQPNPEGNKTLQSSAEVQNKFFKPGKSIWLNDVPTNTTDEDANSEISSARSRGPSISQSIEVETQANLPSTNSKAPQPPTETPPSLPNESSLAPLPSSLYSNLDYRNRQQPLNIESENKEQSKIYGFEEYIGEAEKEILMCLVNGTCTKTHEHSDSPRVVILAHPTFISSISLLRFLIHQQ